MSVGGPTRVTSAPSAESALHVGAGDPGVLDVADDRDLHAGERVAPVAPQGEGVEQRLGRVLVPAVTGVDDRGVDPAGDPLRDAARAVPHDDGVDAHGLDGADGVEQRLALPQRGRTGREGHGVGRQALGRRLERQPGAGRVLVEHGDDGLAPQGGDLRDVPSGHFEEGVGEPQHLADPVRPEVVDTQQVLHCLPLFFDALPDLDAVVLVDGDEVDAHVLVPLGGQVLADVVGPDRQLPVPPVDQHGQLHRPGAAEVDDGVHGRPDRPPGEEDVVAEDDDAVLHVARQLGRPEGRHPPGGDVVAVEGDVERADRHLDPFEGGDGLGQPLGHHDAPGVEADQHDVVSAVVPLDDLVCDPGDGPFQVVGLEDPGPEKPMPRTRRVRGSPSRGIAQVVRLPWGPHRIPFTVTSRKVPRAGRDRAHRPRFESRATTERPSLRCAT